MRAVCPIYLFFFLIGASFANENFSIVIPNGKGKQLLRFSVSENAEGLIVKQTDSLELSFSPAGVTLHPDGKTVIAHGTGRNKNDTFSASAKCDDTGKLALISTGSLEQPAGYTSIDRSGKHLLTAHYRSGTISSYRLEPNGSVGTLVQTLKTPKQEAHCLLTTRDNKFAYVSCVKNNNALYQFSFDQNSGKLTPLEPFDAEPPAMFGPRHLAYHPTLPLVYFSNEQQIGVSVYEIGKDGQLTDLQHATTVSRRGPYQKGRRDLNASDLAISPDGKFLYSAMRDFNGEEDSIFTFRIEEDGRLSKIARSLVGDIPWKIDISPSGQHLLICESGDANCSLYKIEEDGSLERTHAIELPSAAKDMVIVD